jgi:hypothetical protein
MPLRSRGDPLSRVCRSWLDFIERKHEFEQFVTRMQSLWRRRGPMKYLQWLRDIRRQRPFAALKIQRWYRQCKQRHIVNKFLRLKRLLQYKNREREWDGMRANDRLGEGMREVERAARRVQQFWRRRGKLRALVRKLQKFEVCGARCRLRFARVASTPLCHSNLGHVLLATTRSHCYSFTRAPHSRCPRDRRCVHRVQELNRDALDSKARELFRWKIDSERYAAVNDKKKLAAVIVAQALIRRFLDRCRWHVHVQAKQRQVGAATLQKHWRRLVARRLVEAKKRLKFTRDLTRWRRRKVRQWSLYLTTHASVSVVSSRCRVARLGCRRVRCVSSLRASCPSSLLSAGREDAAADGLQPPQGPTLVHRDVPGARGAAPRHFHSRVQTEDGAAARQGCDERGAPPP